MQNMICISCPQGCHLTADMVNGECNVSGNRCPRGKVYAQQELTDPRRTVTAVMPSDDPAHPFISVKTAHPCPKAMISGLLNTLYRTKVKTPVKNGDIILKNVDNSGISVIVTENI